MLGQETAFFSAEKKMLRCSCLFALVLVSVAKSEDSCRKNVIGCYNSFLENSDFPDLIEVLQTEEGIETFCREKADQMKCIELNNRCLNAKELEYYGNITHGLLSFHGYLCYDQRERFVNGTGCIYKSRDSMDKCKNGNLSRKKLAEFGVNEKCCVIENYHWCIIEPLMSKCGFQISLLMTEVVNRYYVEYMPTCITDEERHCDELVISAGSRRQGLLSTWILGVYVLVSFKDILRLVKL